MELISILALLLFATDAKAESLAREQCPAVDYSEKLGDIRDQIGVDWCWAFVAADLIGFHQDLKPGQQVAPIDVALNGLTITKEKLWEGAAASGGEASFRTAVKEGVKMPHWRVEDRAFSLGERGGNAAYGVIAYNTRARVCLESELPSQRRAPMLSHEPFTPLPLPKVGESMRDILPKPNKSVEEIDFISAQLRLLGDQSRDQQKMWEPLRAMFSCKNADADFLDSYSNYFEEFNELVLRQVEKEAQSRCVAGPKMRPLEVENIEFEKGEDSPIAERATRVLRSGAPFGISYSQMFLKEGYSQTKDYPTDHASVIAGMRWNEAKKSCEFKLRNSWGGSCRGYRKELQTRCDFGNIWITEAELKSVATRAAFAK